MIRWTIYMPVRHIEWKLKSSLEAGFSPEFYFDIDLIEDSTIINKIISILNEYPNIIPSLHCNFIDLNPGTPDPEIFKITVKRLTKNFEIANKLGIRDLVFHTAYDPFRYQFYKDKFIENSFNFWESVSSYIDGLNISIENVFDREPDVLKTFIVELNKRYSNTNFYWCFDVGHWNLFKEHSIKYWLNQLSDFLYEIHMHDNCGKYDEHLCLGEGNINYDDIYRFLKVYKKNVIINFELEKLELAEKSKKIVIENL